jgi:hypothetical protein
VTVSFSRTLVCSNHILVHRRTYVKVIEMWGGGKRRKPEIVPEDPMAAGTCAASACQLADPNYPLSYGVPVRERYDSTLLPATREQHDQNCTQSR